MVKIVRLVRRALPVYDNSSDLCIKALTENVCGLPNCLIISVIILLWLLNISFGFSCVLRMPLELSMRLRTLWNQLMRKQFPCWLFSLNALAPVKWKKFQFSKYCLSSLSFPFKVFRLESSIWLQSCWLVNKPHKNLLSCHFLVCVRWLWLFRLSSL